MGGGRGGGGGGGGGAKRSPHQPGRVKKNNLKILYMTSRRVYYCVCIIDKVYKDGSYELLLGRMELNC